MVDRSADVKTPGVRSTLTQGHPSAGREDCCLQTLATVLLPKHSLLWHTSTVIGDVQGEHHLSVLGEGEVV